MPVKTTTDLATINPNQKSKIWRTAEGLVRPPSLALTAGLLTLAVYLFLLPTIARTWRATGDEPHYLLAAHSLVADGDFDLANNYAQQDYLAFYLSPDITPQIRTTAAGQQILDHGLGLPLLIAPAYALGGRFGVLLFQVALGGLLAMLTFNLAAQVSGDHPAALVGTLLVMLSPPLLFYPYLVYPELSGAVLTTLILYLALSRDRPTLAWASLTTFSLLALPWLNRRFVPLALLLALILAWSWRRRAAPPAPPEGGEEKKIPPFGGLGGLPHLWGLGAALLSIVALLWFNSLFEAPARVDITAPIDNVAWMSERLLRGVGWLVDQQRGLFIYGPIYIAALWGLPLLLERSLSERRRDWLALLPFLLSLGVTAAAGGFWVAWELGPRFLVVALPTLAPLLALAWRYSRRSKIGWGLILLLFGLSLYHGLVIIQNPDLPYKSSLALHYNQNNQTFALPLTEILPDLAGYTTIFASQADPGSANLVNEDGQTYWLAPAGQPGDIIHPTPLPDLPFGHYRLIWPLEIEADVSPETDLLRLSATLLGGGSLFNKRITPADLDEQGTIRYAFLNGNVDRWRTPPVFQAVSSGQVTLRAGDIRFTPDPYYALFLPYLYLTILLVAVGLTWWRWRQQPTRIAPLDPPEGGEIKISKPQPISSEEVCDLRPPVANRLEAFDCGVLKIPPSGGLGGLWLIWAGLLTLLLIAGGYVLYQQTRSGHAYDAADLYHFVGQPVADAEAGGGRAWQVDPQRDPPQKAIYGPFDSYDAGTYRVTFRLKLAEAATGDQPLARLRVTATDNFDELVTQPLQPEHFSKPGVYHHFVLTVDNPRRQALSFEVDYTGLAPLLIDGVTIEKIE